MTTNVFQTQSQNQNQNQVISDPRQAEILTIQLAQLNFSEFLPIAFSVLEPSVPYIHNWHLDYLAYTLQRTISEPTKIKMAEKVFRHELNPTPNERIKRLIINIPPRSGKSWICSAYRAWVMGHFPHEKFILSATDNDLASKLNMDTKKIMQSEIYKKIFPRVKIDKDTEKLFTTSLGGEMRATTPEGQIIGRGGNYIIGDDLLSPKKAHSQTERENINAYVDRSLITRLNNKITGVLIIIMQRLHELDLTGYLLSKNAHLSQDYKWYQVCLPAIATETKTYSFYNKEVTFEQNTPLQPAREPLSVLEELKMSMTPIEFAGQYLQAPMPIGGALVRLESFQRYNQLPPRDQILYSIHSWDTGIKTAKDNDPSALIKLIVTKTHQIYVVQSKTMKKEYNDLRAAILNEAKNDEYPPHVVLIEDKASGQSLIQDLRRTSNLPIMAVKPEKDKFTRFLAETPQIEAGRVYLPQIATWLYAFEHELLMFPNGAHDDQVDALSQALNWVRLRTGRKFRVGLIDLSTNQSQSNSNENQTASVDKVEALKAQSEALFQ